MPSPQSQLLEDEGHHRASQEFGAKTVHWEDVTRSRNLSGQKRSPKEGSSVLDVPTLPSPFTEFLL